MDCPQCNRVLRANSRKCPCGWKAITSDALPAVCAYPRCPEPARISLPAFVAAQLHEQSHNRVNLCWGHYEAEISLRARARIAAMGLPAELLAPTHNPRQIVARIGVIRQWMADNAAKVRAVYGGPRAARVADRQPGEDFEEDAA